ncbi:hypothetical protein HAX54_036369 [Datura stramonium]|uniref:Sec16 Sec23-binding domain-containing protein n=1 Tax=Datura stramonium TaxID=4076 RepID=A0ABS8VJ42_DATST|nr:hypothetical protein [Datura stramonium]
MASNPPFQVEDQTDEDFFDKLVNDDDDDYRVMMPNSGVDGISGDTGKEGEKVDKGVVSNAKPALLVKGNGEKSSGSLVSLTSGDSDGLLESSNFNLETEVTADKTEKHTSGSGNSGVKEVGWSAFNADPVTNDASGFWIPTWTFSVNWGIIMDVNSSQYWENLYPGWKYGASTGQWYRWIKTAQSVTGTAAESGTTESVTNWNQVGPQLTGIRPHNNNGYPSHVVFDPQYPGWYYDTIALEWRSLERATSSAQSTVQGEPTGSECNQQQHRSNISLNENVAKTNPMSGYRGNQQLKQLQLIFLQAAMLIGKSLIIMGAVPYNAKTIQNQNDQHFFSGGSFGQQFSQPTLQQHEQKHASSDYYGTQTTANYSQQAFQTSVGGSISVLNLMDVVSEKADSSSLVMGACDYAELCADNSVPGPPWLVEVPHVNIVKFRSPFGTEAVLKESDVPEIALAKLFICEEEQDATQSIWHCCPVLAAPTFFVTLRYKATAAEVQSLLVSGRKKKRYNVHKRGSCGAQLLFSLHNLQMALQTLVAGSPLRTLCLLIAGQPADVFSVDSTAQSGMPVVNAVQQPAQFGANIMLDDWEENLAVITANRAKDDELVLIHLGDCLWKERMILLLHTFAINGANNFEQYSDTGRLCLVGADHLKFPRTYASPEAIQRTEIYEYSKVLSSIVEIGKMAGPETETLRQLVSSLEERIKTHQQGGSPQIWLLQGGW